MEAFFRSARQPSRPSEWTLEEAARFAALKEGYLLQFLSTHKKAFATARGLGLPLLQSQPLPPSAAEDGQQRQRAPRSTSAGVPPAGRRANASGSHRGSKRPASQPPRQPQTSASAPATSAASTVGTGRGGVEASCSSGAASEQRPNSAKRRSAERSARRHARRQRAIRCQVLAMLYLLKLRRRARRRRDLQDLSELSDVPEPVSKRDRGSSSTSETSPPSSESDLNEGPPCCMGIAMVPRCEHSNGLQHDWWVCSLCEQRRRRDLPHRSSTRSSAKRASVGWPGSLQR